MRRDNGGHAKHLSFVSFDQSLQSSDAERTGESVVAAHYYWLAELFRLWFARTTVGVVYAEVWDRKFLPKWYAPRSFCAWWMPGWASNAYLSWASAHRHDTQAIWHIYIHCNSSDLDEVTTQDASVISL